MRETSFTTATPSHSVFVVVHVFVLPRFVSFDRMVLLYRTVANPVISLYDENMGSDGSLYVKKNLTAPLYDRQSSTHMLAYCKSYCPHADYLAERGSCRRPHAFP